MVVGHYSRDNNLEEGVLSVAVDRGHNHRQGVRHPLVEEPSNSQAVHHLSVAVDWGNNHRQGARHPLADWEED